MRGPPRRRFVCGLSLLAKARGMVSSTPEVLGGTPVFKGTRIPVHDVADMLANGDRPATIVKAYPQLDPIVFGSLRFMRRPIRREVGHG